MVIAYKQHFQFIMILTVMYITGVWFGPIIYAMFPIVLLLFAIKKRFFELFIVAIWLLILADYVPVKDATYDDLQFAKDLKFLIPLVLIGTIIMYRYDFQPYPKLILWFIPFFIVSILALQYSLKLNVGIEKTISYILFFVCIPFYVNLLHREQGEYFWKALLTFLIGMLSIGIVLRFAAPQIAMIDGNRFKSVLGNPNGLGIFLFLTFALWLIIRELKLAEFTKKENWYILTVLLISLLWSGSRNAMMSILIFFIIQRLVKVHWFMAVIAVMVILTFNDQIFNSFINIIQFFSLEDYFRIESIEEGSGRKVAWVFAWQEIQNYYFIGGGFGHDENIMRPNYYWLSKLGHQGGVHNSYLSMWFDAGIVGIIFYFLAFFINLIRVAKFNSIAIAFGVALMFNINYESWLVGSLNPFQIIFLTIFTTLVSQFSLVADKSEFEIEVENTKLNVNPA